MIISIVVVAAALGVIVLVFRPERRKQYNEFRRPDTTASGFAVFGDPGGAGVSCGGVAAGGCGGDGGGGGC